MARVALDALVLDIHLLGLGPGAEFLATTLEPPPAKAVAGALRSLRRIGALTEPDERLTPLGDAPNPDTAPAADQRLTRHPDAVYSAAQPETTVLNT